MTDLRFRRRSDGTTYEFAVAGTVNGCPDYRRVDHPDVWCRRLPGFGWSVCAGAGQVLSRPFENPGRGELPPEGMWASAKGDRAYVYGMTAG